MSDYVKDELDEETDKFRRKVLDEKDNEDHKIQLESEIKPSTPEIEEIDDRIQDAENINKEHGGLIPDLANEVKRLKKRKELLDDE
tara:strand:- start:459 stop:716 length:258 start_codon:yes stop_codon:yes gene_type:complete